MKARRLNEYGLDEFRRFVSDLRNGGSMNTPTGLLSSEASSEHVDINLELDDTVFGSRYELGVWLTDRLDEEAAGHLVGDAGFWSALALYWFDQLCPVKQGGTRKPAMVYNYILSENYNHRPRHAIYTTWQLVSQYGQDARFMLSKELPVRGELIEQIMARQYYMGCDGVMRAASKLYYDDEKKTFKKGAAARSTPGCVSRFISWLQQLEINYDLYSMSPDALIDLMPSEFDKFKI